MYIFVPIGCWDTTSATAEEKAAGRFKIVMKEDLFEFFVLDFYKNYEIEWHQLSRAGHFRYFFIFSLIKIDFLHFYQVNLTGSGLFK